MKFFDGLPPPLLTDQRDLLHTFPSLIRKKKILIYKILEILSRGQGRGGGREVGITQDDSTDEKTSKDIKFSLILYYFEQHAS